MSRSISLSPFVAKAEAHQFLACFRRWLRQALQGCRRVPWCEASRFNSGQPTGGAGDAHRSPAFLL